VSDIDGGVVVVVACIQSLATFQILNVKKSFTLQKFFFVFCLFITYYICMDYDMLTYIFRFFSTGANCRICLVHRLCNDVKQDI